MNSRSQSASSAPMMPSHSRMPIPSSRTSTAKARRMGRSVCASSSSERRRRKYANTPSAMNARSCCPIALCRRKKSCSSESAGCWSVRISAIALASPAIWFARRLIGLPSRCALRCSPLGRPGGLAGLPSRCALRYSPLGRPCGVTGYLRAARSGIRPWGGPSGSRAPRHCRASVSSTRIESSVASSVAPKMLR